MVDIFEYTMVMFYSIFIVSQGIFPERVRSSETAGIAQIVQSHNYLISIIFLTVGK
jgi:hypothetical protein